MSNGEPGDFGRDVYGDDPKNENLRATIRQAMAFGMSQKFEGPAVFVQAIDAPAPHIAHWRAGGRKTGPWRSLRFCAACPVTDYCALVRKGCALSSNGRPARAFRPKPVDPSKFAAEGFAEALGVYAKAKAAGQIWLNDISTVYALLINAQKETWRVWMRRWQRRIREGEAAVYEWAVARWYAAIFEGRNPRFAVIEGFNTSPFQVREWAAQYYVEQMEAPKYPPPPDDDLVAGLIDCVTVTAQFAVRDFERGDKEQTTENFLAVLADFEEQAKMHTPWLLGLPTDLEFNMGPPATDLSWMIVDDPAGQKEPPEAPSPSAGVDGQREPSTHKAA